MEKAECVIGIAIVLLGAFGGAPHNASTISAALFTPAVAAVDGTHPAHKPQVKAGNEVVMAPGMKITATTRSGTIIITAVDDLTRSYTWEGATRSVEMWPRAERWYGSLGLYYPGPGEHWEDHNGITRGVVEEGQQHFKTMQAALQWIHAQTVEPCVYRDDGLMVGWSKTLPRKQLNVEVWQIYINGKKPQRLPGSQNKMIVVTYMKPASVYASLVEAVRKNNAAAVQTLLDKGANPNVRNSAGVPVLIMAASRGYVTVGRELLDKGADPQVKGQEGTTALLEAVSNRHAEIVKLLIAKGAKVNATYDKGMMQGATALSVATMDGDAAMVSVLLAAGAQANAQAADGSTAMKQAAVMGHKDIVELLLQKGAEIDARDWLGTTPLMNAVLGDHLEVVKLLITKGANVNARDDGKRKLYARAAFMGDVKTQKQLEQSGVLNTRHEDGNSVLDWAKASSNKEIVNLLKQAGARE